MVVAHVPKPTDDAAGPSACRGILRRMRLRLPLLLGALAAAAIAASPAPRGEHRGLLVHEARRGRQGQAQLQEAGQRARQGQALRDRHDDVVRRDHDRPRPQARRADPQLDRVPRHEALLRRAHVPPRDRRVRAAGRRSEGRRHGRPGLPGRRARCRARTATRSATSRWPRPSIATRRARPARSSSSSRAATARSSAARATACSGTPPTRPRSRRSSASTRSPRPPAATRQGCPPSKKVWIVTTRLVTLS